MKRHPLVLAMLLATSFAWASIGSPGDSITRKPSRYYFSVRSAILPCSTCNIDGKVIGLLSTVHGFKLNKTFGVGVGAGVTSSGNAWIVPVFGNFRMNMPVKKNRKNKMFFDLNYGWGLAPANYRETEFGSQSTTCRSYIQPSVGYSIGYHDMRIGIMLGSQAINMTTRSEYPGYSYGWGFTSTASPTVSEFKYAVTRMLVGISIGWKD